LATAERDRLATLLKQSADASKQLANFDLTVHQANARLTQIEKELNSLAKDTSGLAQALAGIAPHIHDDNCPVCSRNFREVRRGPLAAHLAATIAALTSQAGRIRALTNSRNEETGRIAAVERQRATIKRLELNQRNLTSNALKRALMEESVVELVALATATTRGVRMLQLYNSTRNELAQLSGRDQAIDAIRADLDRWIKDYDFGALEDDLEIGRAIETLIKKIDLEIGGLKAQEQKRQELVARLQEVIGYLEQLAEIDRERARYEKRSGALHAAEGKITSLRNDARKLSQAAFDGRASIVGRVFNTSLNKVWRDLFVRLAPTELFVPAFKLPTSSGKRAIEAQLQTLHRVDGTEGGPPGTMLSAGNLNTAALTLFLALHLSVRKTLPWLILDDPVQSMDDVHISQFAALLRMISKRLQRQIVLAVHDRALFEYLMLELSPAFDGDRLITVELSRTADGTAIATPTVLTYEKDTAIAA
jgi:exonuclease SbcC